MKDEQQALLRKLANDGEYIVSSRNPKTCRVILSAAEMLADSPYPNQPGMFVGAGRKLSTHYVVGLIWSGNAHQDENGCEVYGLPKKHISESTLATIVAVLMKLNEGRTWKNAARPTTDDWKALAGNLPVKVYEGSVSPREPEMPDNTDREPLSSKTPLNRKPEIQIGVKPTGNTTHPTIYELLKPLILDFVIIEDVKVPLSISCDSDAYIQEAATRLRDVITKVIEQSLVKVSGDEAQQICNRSASEAFVLRRLRLGLLAGEVTVREIEHLDLYRTYKDYFWRTPHILAKEREIEAYVDRLRRP